MELTFRAAKMIERCEREGLSALLDPKTRAFIQSLDGKTADTNNWQNVVHGEPLAYIAPDGEQDGTYVSVEDCE